MTIAKYSQETQGIYPLSVYSDFPPDALDIDDDLYGSYIRAEIVRFDAADGVVIAYVPPAITIDDAKTTRIQEIGYNWKAEIDLGFVTSSTIKMKCDITDIQRLKSAYDLAVLLSQSTVAVVVDYDNVSHADMPVANVLTLVTDLGTRYQTRYGYHQSLRTTINAVTEVGAGSYAAAIAEINAVVWVSG